jgi:hypothetical protein
MDTNTILEMTTAELIHLSQCPNCQEARPTPRSDVREASAAFPLSFLQEDATSLTSGVSDAVSDGVSDGTRVAVETSKQPAATVATVATVAPASDEFLTEAGEKDL